MHPPFEQICAQSHRQCQTGNRQGPEAPGSCQGLAVPRERSVGLGSCGLFVRRERRAAAFPPGLQLGSAVARRVQHKPTELTSLPPLSERQLYTGLIRFLARQPTSFD